MKISPHFKIIIEGQLIDLVNLSDFQPKEDWQKAIFQFLVAFNNHHTYVEVKTSGSTGAPKTIKIGKEKMRNSAKLTGSFLNLQPHNKALLCLSANYIAGKMMLVRTLVLGLELHCVSPTKLNLETTNQHFDFCAMVPLQAMKNLNHLNKIKKLIIGGGDIPASAKRNFIDLNHLGIYQTFGMTETISHIALKKINEIENRCLPQIKVSLSADETLKIDAPLLLEKPIVTNDLVTIISNTSFEWLGRKDNIINTGGVKIIPERVENILSKHIVTPFFIAGVPDKILGEKLVLITEKQSVKIEKEKWLTIGLHAYEIPKENIVFENFVKTETGKNNRRKTLGLIH